MSVIDEDVTAYINARLQKAIRDADREAFRVLVTGDGEPVIVTGVLG